jgi:antitoxin component YwqK of YwqJK toxin-antitoxin module
MVEDKPDGYWEWYRSDGTKKRSGYFEMGEPVGEWVTYDSKGEKYKTKKEISWPINGPSNTKIESQKSFSS